ncbi:MAG: hypothetical protein JO189_26185 [Deltaproteobacteria bacterium]|nr:hypothetical protein [Deltaproteobacteria bacterium]
MPIDLDKVKAAAIHIYGDMPGVEGIGIGDQSLRIYVRNPEVRQHLPQQFQGVPIDFVVTGDISTDW